MFKEILNRITTRDVMALELSTALVGLTFLLALRAPESDAFKMLLGGMLTTGFATAVGFYFNSSKGSDDKNKALESATAALATSTPAQPMTTTTTLDPGPPLTATTTTTPAEPPPPPPPEPPARPGGI